MGFGGSVQGMITSLKNNKRERKSIYDDNNNPKESGYGKIENDKKLSPEELNTFREQLKANRRPHQQNVWLVFGVIMIVIIIVISYFLFLYS